MFFINECRASPKQKEYRLNQGFCTDHQLLDMTSCIQYGCFWTSTWSVGTFCKIYKEGDGDAPVMHTEVRMDPSYETDKTQPVSSKLLAVSDHVLSKGDDVLLQLATHDMGGRDTNEDLLTENQQINRAAVHLHKNGAFDAPDKVLDRHFYTPEVTHKLMVNAVSMMQLASSAHASQDAYAKAQSVGLLSIPNKCANDAEIGNTFQIAINKATPPIITCLMSWGGGGGLINCLPQLYVAMNPIRIQGSSIDARCLVASVAADQESKIRITKEELDKKQNEGLEANLMSEENLPNGELGDAVRNAKLNDHHHHRFQHYRHERQKSSAHVPVGAATGAP